MGVEHCFPTGAAFFFVCLSHKLSCSWKVVNLVDLTGQGNADPDCAKLKLMRRVPVFSSQRYNDSTVCQCRIIQKREKKTTTYNNVLLSCADCTFGGKRKVSLMALLTLLLVSPSSTELKRIDRYGRIKAQDNEQISLWRTEN